MILVRGIANELAEKSTDGHFQPAARKPDTQIEKKYEKSKTDMLTIERGSRQTFAVCDMLFDI